MAKYSNLVAHIDSSVRAGHLKRRLGINITNILQQHNEFNDNAGDHWTLSQPTMSTFHLFYYLVASCKNLRDITNITYRIETGKQRLSNNSTYDERRHKRRITTKHSVHKRSFFHVRLRKAKLPKHYGLRNVHGKTRTAERT